MADELPDLLQCSPRQLQGRLNIEPSALLMIELARREGAFGTIRILEQSSDKARIYMIGDTAQTMVDRDGVSVSGYVHAIELLVRGAQSVLMIGGGGGGLATMLARTGSRVTVVDIDPESEDLARRYFWLDPNVHWVTADAIRFVETGRQQFDAIIVDACDGFGIVKPFDDPETLAWLLDRACPAGSLVVNLARNDNLPTHGKRRTRELAARGLSATLYSAREGDEGNEVLHVRQAGPTRSLVVTDLERRPVNAQIFLTSLQAYTPRPTRISSTTRSEHDAER
jgi:SAM-dependent methyltransferase